jgi:hypothetical protein
MGLALRSADCFNTFGRCYRATVEREREATESSAGSPIWGKVRRDGLIFLSINVFH